jgi:hypothetical protein
MFHYDSGKERLERCAEVAEFLPDLAHFLATSDGAGDADIHLIDGLDGRVFEELSVLVDGCHGNLRVLKFEKHSDSIYENVR